MFNKRISTCQNSLLSYSQIYSMFYLTNAFFTLTVPPKLMCFLIQLTIIVMFHSYHRVFAQVVYFSWKLLFFFIHSVDFYYSSFISQLECPSLKNSYFASLTRPNVFLRAFKTLCMSHSLDSLLLKFYIYYRIMQLIVFY